jgi:hypothetical protein
MKRASTGLETSRAKKVGTPPSLPVLEDWDYEGSLHLVCPECGESVLHQDRVEVIIRDNDEEDATVTITDHKGTRLARRVKSKCPGRRDSLFIHFSCEQCHGSNERGKELFRLCIRQHKGSTLFKWDGFDDAKK